MNFSRRRGLIWRIQPDPRIPRKRVEPMGDSVSTGLRGPRFEKNFDSVCVGPEKSLRVQIQK